MAQVVRLHHLDVSRLTALEIRAGDKILGVDNKVIYHEAPPYVLVLENKTAAADVEIWSVRCTPLSQGQEEFSLELTARAQVYVVQHSGQASEFKLFLVSLEPAGKKETRKFKLFANESPIPEQPRLRHIGTGGAGSEKRVHVFEVLPD